MSKISEFTLPKVVSRLTTLLNAICILKCAPTEKFGAVWQKPLKYTGRQMHTHKILPGVLNIKDLRPASLRSITASGGAKPIQKIRITSHEEIHRERTGSRVHRNFSNCSSLESSVKQGQSKNKLILAFGGWNKNIFVQRKLNLVLSGHDGHRIPRRLYLYSGNAKPQHDERKSKVQRLIEAVGRPKGKFVFASKICTLRLIRKQTEI